MINNFHSVSYGHVVQRRRTAGVYFGVCLRVMAYLILNLVHSMQYILTEFVVRSMLVCDFEHSLCFKEMSHFLYWNKNMNPVHCCGTKEKFTNKFLLPRINPFHFGQLTFIVSPCNDPMTFPYTGAPSDKVWKFSCCCSRSLGNLNLQ